MAMEGWILQSSLAGLLSSNAAWPLSKLPLPEPFANLLQQSGLQSPSLDALGVARDALTSAPFINAPFVDALARESTQRMEAFVRGVKTYQAHTFTRALKEPPTVWRRGVATLRAYGETGAPVLYVPSLINRAYILDLAEDRSLLRATAKAGFHGFLLDWGDPGPAEKCFTVEDYIDGVLIPALEEVKARTGKPAHLVGYCLGGTLAVAPAVLRPDLVASLVLLAAPWDFHEGTDASRVLLTWSQPMIEMMLKAQGVAPIDLLQSFFASLDPTLVGRKFRTFAALDPASDQARRFVELEDWLNDGIPLAGPVAEEVLFRWYGENDPLQGRWRVNDVVIDPARVACPTLAFIPSQDRIVPPESARRLAQGIKGAEARQVDLGHIGMIAGGSAPKRVYAPLLEWLKTSIS